MREKSGFLKGLISGLCLALIIVLCLFFVNKFILDDNINIQQTNIEDESVIKKVQLIQQLMDEYYLNEVDAAALIEGVYKGFVDGLGDVYSVYYTAEEYASVVESVSGKYSGIGVSVSQDDTGLITIIRPFENAPGFLAGLRAGDILYAVDDEKVEGIDLNTVVAKIKGKAGSTVKISVIREGETDVIDYTVERKDIEIPTVEYSMKDNNIGYIYVGSFDTVTLEQFSAALDSLTEQKMEGLVIDLRDNPGGSLSTVVEMLDLLLPKGLIVYTEDKSGNRSEEYNSDDEHQLNVPLSVIVNGNSASASEIFAGAIQDYGIGEIVGKTTFGKGVVQTILPLTDGSAVKLTIANYFTPNGNNINGIGIVPDFEIDIPKEAYADKIIDPEEDTQLQKATELLVK